MENFKTIDYRKKFFIEGLGDSVAVEFYDAGHILGSAMVVLEIKENGKKIRFAFSGDIGRHNLPILRDPEFIGDCDYFIPNLLTAEECMTKLLRWTSSFRMFLKRQFQEEEKQLSRFQCRKNPGDNLRFSYNFQRGDMAPFPVFVDSPLSARATTFLRSIRNVMTKN